MTDARLGYHIYMVRRVCEAVFFQINSVKNIIRSCLTDYHLNDLIKISCTNFKH